jgi:hypothetical protein
MNGSHAIWPTHDAIKIIEEEEKAHATKSPLAPPPQASSPPEKK